MHWQVIAVLLVIYDVVAVHAAYFAALWVRYDCAYSSIPERFFHAYLSSVTLYSVFFAAVFIAFHMYRSVWRFSSSRDLIRTACLSLAASAVYSILITVLLRRMPFSYYLWGALAQLLLVFLPRFVYRFFASQISLFRRPDDTASRVMLIGAGSAGQMILQDTLHAKEIRDRVVCIVDDNRNKWGRYIEGVPIVGGRDDILLNVKKYRVSKIYLAIPSASAEDKRDIIAICNETGCQLKQLPGMYQIVLGEVNVSNMRDVSVEDLLGREPIRADLKEVFEYIHGKTVLVTGGGGSIGSELCRQIAARDPKCLILFDIYENSTYSVQLELKDKYPDLNLIVLIGSVRDSRRLFDVFGTYRPQIVYHAAAHKHVPLMEDSPNEAVKNNAQGTYKTAYAAMTHGCERFVLISTDKAVNPTNVMGASKRLCEMIIQTFDAKVKAGRARDLPEPFAHESAAEKPPLPADAFDGIRTEFVAVRFGNVLGSNGSVIPIFKKQIEKGGPVTVTHPDIIRYFMTIPEAVSLVMQAGVYAHGGEIFVLDMGSPVKIDTLARNLIKLCGLKPDVDIPIVYTGLRPGEKLYEEKLMAEEGLQKTDNEMIHIGKPIPFDTDVFLRQFGDLTRAAFENAPDIRERLARIVVTYHSAEPLPAGGGPRGSASRGERL